MQIKQLMKENFCIENIRNDDRLREDLGIDSLSFLSFLTDLYDFWDISLEVNELSGVVTVKDLLNKIEEAHGYKISDN